MYAEINNLTLSLFLLCPDFQYVNTIVTVS
jgi:hypothetical protein